MVDWETSKDGTEEPTGGGEAERREEARDRRRNEESDSAERMKPEKSPDPWNDKDPWGGKGKNGKNSGSNPAHAALHPPENTGPPLFSEAGVIARAEAVK